MGRENRKNRNDVIIEQEWCKKANNGVLMSNGMSHTTGRDDKDDRSHDGRRSGPIRREL